MNKILFLVFSCFLLVGCALHPPSDLGNHSVYVAHSSDAIEWRVNPFPIYTEASVPNLLQLHADVGSFEAGEVLAHFVDASNFNGRGDEAIGYGVSSDGGKTWSERGQLQIDGLGWRVVPVDPSMVQLEDGRLRLYFYDINTKWDKNYQFYAATSEDGVNFVVDGLIYEENEHMATDPEVVWYKGEWLMFFALNAGLENEGFIGVARSDDGLNFERMEPFELIGIPGTLVVNESLYIYGCGVGISRVRFGDERASYMDRMTEAGYCDPDPIQLENGSFLMLVKGHAEALSSGYDQ